MNTCKNCENRLVCINKKYPIGKFDKCLKRCDKYKEEKEESHN
jgi:hypothetical protein